MSGAKFITLEGIEGAGKSTIVKFVCEWLRARGLAVRATREPGGTPLAERLRQLVLERGEESISPVAETLIMFAARSLHVQNVILPALSRGEWVVCDRFTDATHAYQGSGRGVEAQLIDTLAAAVHAHLRPARTLLLDLPVAVGLARARARTHALSDRFEAETLGFFEKVRAGYLTLAAREPGRFVILDASAPLSAVEERVAQVLAQLHAPGPPQ